MDSNWLKKLALAGIPTGLTIPLRTLLVENYVTGDYSSYDEAKAAAATLGISFQSPDYARLTARNWEIAHPAREAPLLSANAAGVLMATPAALVCGGKLAGRVWRWGGGGW